MRSRFLAMFDTVLQPFLEKLSGRIAVSAAARKVIVEHLGADAVVIPNGVARRALPRGRATCRASARRRHDRLHRPLRRAAQGHGRSDRRDGTARPEPPDLQSVVAGRGDAEEFLAGLPAAVRGRVTCSVRSARTTRRACCAASTCTARRTPGRRASAIILLEAMAAGAADRRQRSRGIPSRARRAGGRTAVPDRRPRGAGVALAGMLDDPARAPS